MTDLHVDGEKPAHEIHITVDGEPETVKTSTMTAREIISTLAHRDPSSHYLVQIHGHERTSYKDNPDEPIELKNGMRFQTVSLGPTPVSDGSSRLVGTEFFLEGLRRMGHEPQVLSDRPDHVVIDYVVETGSKAGAKVRMGFIVPADFPATAPTGPHVSPHVFPIKTDGSHPHGAIHEQQAQPFSQALGGPWQYWSRPCDWSSRKKTVASYMSHVWNLWDSQ